MGESFKVIDNRHSAKSREPQWGNPTVVKSQPAKVGRVPDSTRQPSAMDDLISMPSWMRRTAKTDIDK